jgi:hypothetical protein
MAKHISSADEWLRTEYATLSNYFGNVITFRFTTASFFITTVALVLQIESPKPAHYVLLFAASLGISKPQETSETSGTDHG